MAVERHLDDEPLSTGTHKGQNDTLTLSDPGADFLSCGVRAGVYIENITDGSSGLVSAVAEDSLITVLSGGLRNSWQARENLGGPEAPIDGTTEGSGAADPAEDPTLTIEIETVAGNLYEIFGTLTSRIALLIIYGAGGAVLYQGDSTSVHPPRRFVADGSRAEAHLYLREDPGVDYDDTIDIRDLSSESGDTYEIYKTAVKDSEISRTYVDRRFGQRVYRRDQLNEYGHLVDDEDIDIHNPGKVFGPGQPERGRRR